MDVMTPRQALLRQASEAAGRRRQIPAASGQWPAVARKSDIPGPSFPDPGL